LLNFHAPEEIPTGAPVVLSIELLGPAIGAVLQVRGPDEAGYVPLQMHADGPGYWSASIPVDRIKTPTVLFFIEAVDAKGVAEPIEGTAESPHGIKVFGPPRPEAPKSWESTASIWTDYADYNRLRGNDYAWQTEGWFGMRFGDIGLRAIRSGFGVYKGKGGGL